MEYYTFEQLKEMAFKDGIIGNKVAVGIWAKMNGFLKKKKQINKRSSVHKYSEINFHLILFPVPDKTKIVNWFISQAKNLKNDADE